MPGSVIVIDDSQTIRTVVQMALQGAGYQVQASDTAEGGIRAVRAAPPDLVLLDYLLPDQTGDAVCRALASDPRTAKVRILVLSAKGEELRARATSWPGVVGVMSKPFTSAALVARISEMLGQGGEAGWSFSEQNAVAQAIFQTLKPALRELPGWEQARAGSQASTYFAQRLLTPAAIAGLMTAITPVMTDLLHRRAVDAGPALSGSLAQLPLIEVLRLVEGAGHSGRLDLVNDGLRSVLHLDHGRVVGVAAPPESERAHLRSAFPHLGESQVAAAVSSVASEGLPAVAAIAQADLGTSPPVTFERLRGHLRTMSERELGRLWDAHGTFALHPGPVASPVARFEVVINPAQIALARLRLVDDLAQIEAYAGRLEVIFTRRPGVAGQLASLALHDDERRVLALIDGLRDTGSVVRGVGLGLLPVLRIIFRFTRLGLIGPADTARAAAGLVVIAAPGEIGEGRLGEALAGAWDASGRGPAQVFEVDDPAVNDSFAGAAPVAVVIEISSANEPLTAARQLRERLPTGIPLFALCAEDPPALTTWTAAFDGVLVPPLHIDDITRLLAG